MKRKEEQLARKCPRCGATEKQRNNGTNRSGSQQRSCAICKKYYTVDPKTREYPDEVKAQAIKIYFEGNSARAVGRLLGMSKANVLNWIKKNAEAAASSVQ